jgi:hypothetical protein
MGWAGQRAPRAVVLACREFRALSSRPPDLPTNQMMKRESTEQQRMEEALAERTAELEDARSFLDSVSVRPSMNATHSVSPRA